MGLSQPRAFYSIDRFVPFDLTTGEFKGTLRVLGEGSLNVTGELVGLNGGTNKYEWHVEDGLSTAEVSLTMREYPDFIFELFLGKAPTANAAEASGDVSALVNKKGTSVFDATTGIASVAAVTPADLPAGVYIVKAVSATTVDVYLSTDQDKKQAALDFQDDQGKITASPLTIPGTSGTVAIPNTGLQFTGGSGSIAMTTGDTARFEVRSINNGSSIVKIGGLTDVNQEFGAFIYAKKRSNYEMVEFEVYRLKASGAAIPLAENSWAESALTAKAIYDADQDALYQMRFMKNAS